MNEEALSSITVSIISHGQGKLVAALLEDLARCHSRTKIILTLNVPETDEIECPQSLRPFLQVIRNEHPKGFAANHNQAFKYCKTPFFAVLNPDLRINTDPFPQLSKMATRPQIGLVAPSVRNPRGELEDNARHFPTILQLLNKLLRRKDGRVMYDGTGAMAVDWTAGMFMLFKAEAFQKIAGFDERFFLYYEDVDICARLWKAGFQVVFHPDVTVIHAAQRASHQHPRYMAWHLSSMARYFLKHAWRLPR